MSGPDWYRWYPTKWLAGTLGLTNEQRGVYIQIINVILDRGDCPTDEDYLMRLCNCHRRPLRRVIRELLALGKITKNGANFEQTRAKLERKESETFSELQRNRASKRWKNNELTDAIPGICLTTTVYKEETPPSLPYEDSTNLLQVYHSPSRGNDTHENVQLELEGTTKNGNGHIPPKRKPTAKPARKLPTAIPDDWTPDLEYAKHHGMRAQEINLQANKLIDWSKASGKRYCDWDAVWRNWVRTYVERREHGSQFQH